MEVSLHSHIGQHPNIIEWFASGEDDIWKWIAMEFAEGGDLFDKIEADVGVNEDIAHFYFTQLVSGVSYMHSKGVGHRDIKPENILLSESGNLKIADFGLATLFKYNGASKLSTTMCGSPPYIAPEVISCAKVGNQMRAPKGTGYSADLVDIWSCGVVLFVLLVGNTPWDEPTSTSWEFEEYMRFKGRTSDELWKRLPPMVMSLLRGMMSVDVVKRFTFEQVKQHPWFTRSNALLSSNGTATNQLFLATQMLENLRIDFNDETLSQRQSQAMDVDSQEPWSVRFSATQPETPMNGVQFDWERPPRVNAGISASQPTAANDKTLRTPVGRIVPQSWEHLSEEPSMSQFSATPTVPMSLTQHARRFRDIVPSYSLTRFFSHLVPELLIELLTGALHNLNVPMPTQPVVRGHDNAAWIKVKTVDGRRCGLSGDIIVDRYVTGEQDLLEIRFVKTKGDPLEWRRFFKRVVVLCKEGVYVPGA